MAVKYFTHEERLEIERLLKCGLSFKEIGKSINRPFCSVRNEVRRMGGKDKYEAISATEFSTVSKQKRIDGIARQLSPEREAEMLRLCAEGRSMTYIRDKLQTSFQTVKKILKKHNLETAHSTYDIMMERISSLEMQVEILTEIIKRNNN